MGSFGIHVGLTLVSLWTLLGILLGSYFDYVCIILGACWDNLGIFFEKHKITFEYFLHMLVIMRGSLFDHFGIVLGSFWDHFGIILGSF